MSFEMKLNTKVDLRKNDKIGRRNYREFSNVFISWSAKFDSSLSFRHKILNMLTKNPPFTKNMESPLCNEALVDQLWKLMNSGETAVAFKIFLL